MNEWFDMHIPDGWDCGYATSSEHWGLLWRTRLSSLYHLKRERFLSGVFLAFTLWGGLSGVGLIYLAMLPPSHALNVVLTSVAIWVFVFPFFQPDKLARKHAALARDFKQLEAQIPALRTRCTLELLGTLSTRYTYIESGEPAALGALVRHCHNELCMHHGHPDRVVPMPALHRLLKNWFDFDQTK
jgi:hypothetical protein